MLAVQKTTAYNNKFFRFAEKKAHVYHPGIIVREWFPVTQAFCVALPSYVSLLLKNLVSCSVEERISREEIILVPMAIGSGEFGFGTHGIEGIHYRMFARLGGALHISLDELYNNPRGILPETGRLVDGINEALSDIYKGAGCIRVVEGTAYKIVEAMDRLFRPMTSSGGEPLFSEYDLEYITLHLELEKEHDVMADKFVEKSCVNEKEKGKVNSSIERISSLFGDYWEAIADEVF